MNRTKQLKLLDEEICRLFFEGISENDTFSQLKSDPRFDTVRRVSVQSLYSKLKNDVDKQARTKELKKHKRYRQNADNLLLYENRLTKKEFEVFKNVWEGRYFSAIESINESKFTYKVTDLYQNVSKEVSLFADDTAYVIFHPLNGQFALAETMQRTNDLHFVHLVYIDLVESKMELVHEVRRDERRFVNVFVDSVDRSKFGLMFFVGQGFSVVEYSLSKGKISVGEEVVLLGAYDYISGNFSYFNKKLFGLEFDDGHRNDMNYASIFVQDLTGEKERKTLKLEPLPKNVCYQMPSLRSPYQWFCDHVFIPIRFVSTGFYGISFTEPRTRKWAVLEFVTNLPITKLTVVENCSLLVFAEKRRHVYFSSEVSTEVSKIYKLPIRKPESLRYKAWLKTVAWFKKQQVADPYKEARRFLPFNSEIHTPFTVDEQGNDGQE